MTPRAVVRAAGGVVWRRRDDGRLEVLLVHRPRYDDWTLPKGKNDFAERDEDCALREVREETGFRCLLGEELATVEYRDERGRPKAARYWAMTVEADVGWEGGDEVDGREWLPLAKARRRLSYDRDGLVLDAFERRVIART